MYYPEYLSVPEPNSSYPTEPTRSILAPLPRSNLAPELVSAASEAPARPISHNPRLRSSHTLGRRRSRCTSSSPSPFARPASARFRLDPISPSPFFSPASARLHLERVGSGGSGTAFSPSPAPPFRRRFTWSTWSAGEAAPSSLHRRHLPSDTSPAVPPSSAARSQRQRAPRSDVLGWPSPASRPAVSPLSVVRSSSFAMLASHCFLKCSQLYIFKLYHCEKSIQIH